MFGCYVLVFIIVICRKGTTCSTHSITLPILSPIIFQSLANAPGGAAIRSGLAYIQICFIFATIVAWVHWLSGTKDTLGMVFV